MKLWNFVGHRELAIFCKIKSLKSVYILIVSLCINYLQLKLFHVPTAKLEVKDYITHLNFLHACSRL